MKEQNGYIEGVNGTRLHYQAWIPDQQPKAILAMVHGVGEHIGRYQNVVNVLVPAGYLLVGYDRRGHGKSDGMHGHIDSWDEYRNDLGIFLSMAQNLVPNLPMFLYGHSQGSLDVLSYLLRQPEGLNGVILSGTALEPNPEVAAPPHLVFIAKVLSRIQPTFLLATELDGSVISRDLQAAKAYMEDPLVHQKRTARWADESLKIIEWIKRHPSELRLPVLFLHGEKDAVVTAAGAQRFFEKVASADKTIHIYPGGMHEPHNDLDHRQVVQDIQTWLDAHL